MADINMSSDLPDYTQQQTVNSDVEVNTSVDIRPKGGIIETGEATTTASYASICSHTVTNNKKFDVSKIMVCCTKAAWVKYQWNGSDISAPRLLSDNGMYFEHFTLDYYSMTGNGSKKFDVLIKWVTEAGTAEAEINGEETG